MHATRKHFINGGKRGKLQPPQKTASLSEPRIAAYTTRKTVNRLARKRRLHFGIYVVSEQPKRGTNLTSETKALLDPVS